MTTKFLCELIEKNPRVILPEFGAFLVKEDGTGVFKPDNITFSPFLRYNDGSVEDALANTNKISKDEAKKLISNFIEEIKQKLDEEKQLKIEDFGYLYLDSRGSVHFSTSAPGIAPKPKEVAKKENKPEKVVDEVKETPPVVIKKEEKPEIKTEEPITKKDEIVEEKTPAKETPKAPIIKEEIKKEEQKAEAIKEKKPEIPKTEPKKTTSLPKSKPVLQAVPPQKPPTPKTAKSGGASTGKAILIGTLIGLGLVVVLAGGWYVIDNDMLNFKKTKTEAPLVEPLPKDKPEDLAKDESTKTEDASPSGKFDDEFNKLSSEMDSKTSSVDSQQGKPKNETRIAPSASQVEKITIPHSPEGVFHLIVGSFRNSEYADKFSADMQSAGYNSRVIVQPSGMHAVTLGSFITRNDAVNAMNELKSKHPNVWILNQ